MPSRAESTRVPSLRNALGAGAIALVAAMLLQGCAGSPERVAPAPPDNPALDQIALRLPGEYISVRGEDRGVQRLTIEGRSGERPGARAFSMTQRATEGGPVRRFGLILEPSRLDNRLDGELALLDANEQARRGCAMRFHLNGRELVGETDPADCLFGEGADRVGLLKEMSFDGRRLAIADRLIDPETGQGRGPDSVIRFYPRTNFEGWLGVRDGDDWRVARELTLGPGESVVPLDAAEMSLGLSVSLDYYRIDRDGGRVVLRLTVRRSDSGEILGEAWSEPGSPELGLALPDLQFGLSRRGR
jgi:hypothetical protein